MAKKDPRTQTGPARKIEPRGQYGRGRGGWAFLFEIHAAVGVQITRPGQDIGNQAQAFLALERGVPGARFIAIHRRQEITPVGARQGLLQLPRQRLGQIQAPAGQQAGVDHQVVTLPVEQGLATQPAQQGLTIRRREDLGQRVLTVWRDKTLGHRQKMQVVITQHHRDLSIVLHTPAQHPGGVLAPINQVAGQPDAIPSRVKGHHLHHLQEV